MHARLAVCDARKCEKLACWIDQLRSFGETNPNTTCCHWLQQVRHSLLTPTCIRITEHFSSSCPRTTRAWPISLSGKFRKISFSTTFWPHRLMFPPLNMTRKYRGRLARCLRAKLSFHTSLNTVSSNIVHKCYIGNKI